MSSYLKDARTIVLGNVISALTALGFQSCLGWFLGPGGRGEYTACMVFVSILILACALGQEMANTYFVGSGRLTVSKAMTQSLLIGVATSVIACTIGYYITVTNLSFLEKAPRSLFRLSLLHIPATIFFMYLSQILLGMGQVRIFNLLTVLPRVLALAFVLVASAFRLDVQTTILIEIVTLFVTIPVILVFLVRKFGARWTWPTAAELAMSLGYGLRFYVGKLAALTNVQLGSIVLMFAVVSREELGLFGSISALSARMWLVAEGLQLAMMPRTSGDPEGSPDLAAQCTRMCATGTLALAVVAAIFSQPIISLILSPKFLPATVPFLLLLPGVVIRVLPKTLTAYFNGIGRPGVVSWSIGVSALVNLGLMLLFLPRWGLNGTAAAISIAYGLEAIFIGLAFWKYSGRPFSSLIWMRRDDWRQLREAMSRSRK